MVVDDKGYKQIIISAHQLDEEDSRWLWHFSGPQLIGNPGTMAQMSALLHSYDDYRLFLLINPFNIWSMKCHSICGFFLQIVS